MMRLWAKDSTTLQDVHACILRARDIYCDDRWSEVAKALKVPAAEQEAFVEYKKFLSLKLAFQDFRSQMLSPDKEIDEWWHKHLLQDTASYMQFCVDMAGEMVHHTGLTDSETLTRMYMNFVAMRDLAWPSAVFEKKPGNSKKRAVSCGQPHMCG